MRKKFQVEMCQGSLQDEEEAATRTDQDVRQPGLWVKSKFLKEAKRCLVFSLFEDRCIDSIYLVALNK